MRQTITGCDAGFEDQLFPAQVTTSLNCPCLLLCNPLKGDPFSFSIRTGDIHVHVRAVLDGESVFDFTS